MNRDIVFDIFKGIGIILMVAAHAHCPIKGDIYMFHMAIFFIVFQESFLKKSIMKILQMC